MAATDDSIRHYTDLAGGVFTVLFSFNFPYQISPNLSGGYVATAFSANQVREFDLSNTSISTFTVSTGRGVNTMDNGNFIASDGTSLVELDRSTGSRTTIRSGPTFRMIERAFVDPSLITSSP